MNQTLFYVFGIALAISAVTTAFVGLKLADFPGKAMPLVIAWFAFLIIGAGTFAVLNGKDEDKEHAKEYGQAGKEIEKETSSGPYEPEVSAEGSEASGSEEGSEGEATEAEGPAEGGEGAEAEEPAGGASGEEASGGGGNPEAGESVFAENCAVCHGSDGHGGSGGPDLRTMPLAKTEEGAIQQVTNGGGGMPAFGEQLSPEEIEDVASYVSGVIVGGE